MSTTATPDPVSSFAASLLDELEPRLRAIVAEEVERRISPSSPWLTVPAAAAYLGVTEHSIRSMMARGDVPQHKPNGRVWIARESLNLFVRGG